MPDETDRFTQFWQHYLLNHAQKGTRLMHVLGTSLAVATLILGIVMLNPIYPILGIAMAYALSWSGHLLIERNRPVMPEHPAWSLQCDVRMFRLWLSGRLNRECARVRETQ